LPPLLSAFSKSKITHQVILLTALWLCLAAPALAERIGIYSGTFDPPHLGHHALVSSALVELQLDQIYILPNYSPSHKPGSSSFAHRSAMVQLWLQADSRLRSLPESTFAALWQHQADDYMGALRQHIHDQHGPQHDYFQLMGTDSFNKLVAYNKLPTAQENRIVAVFQRPGYVAVQTPAVLQAVQAGRVQWIQAQQPEISSSALRQKIAKSDCLEDQEHILKSIMKYICQENLYRVKIEASLF